MSKKINKDIDLSEEFLKYMFFSLLIFLKLDKRIFFTKFYFYYKKYI